LANFCFATNSTNNNSNDSELVAAVDFQYVGSGCGMKDIAYFIGSCLYDEDCERFEQQLLDFYFSELRNALNARKTEMISKIDFSELEVEWREMYSLAWTDFHRFVKGWSPGHWKIHGYSERLAKEVIARIALYKRYSYL
ncbi:MAG: DUF1679 domain-containing protein, partial [Kangiellaceae bacterium]|nr:DUF1679 domain-containing protein [Kangiellaceae bacterium]